MQFDEKWLMESNKMPIRELLVSIVGLEQQEPVDYALRNRAVIQLFALCESVGYEVGIRIDPDEPQWPVIFIELPGDLQVSWHVPQHSKPWDGHTTEEKLNRIRRYVAGV